MRKEVEVKIDHKTEAAILSSNLKTERFHLTIYPKSLEIFAKNVQEYNMPESNNSQIYHTLRGCSNPCELDMIVHFPKSLSQQRVLEASSGPKASGFKRSTCAHV